MVICYTIKELNAIGEKVILSELSGKLCQKQTISHDFPPDSEINSLVSSTVPGNGYNFQQELLQFEQQIHQLGLQIRVNRAPPVPHYQPSVIGAYQPIRQEPQLTSSVAEFFRKATLNLNPQANIDTSKVRRLSEVEAELLGRREDTQT